MVRASSGYGEEANKRGVLGWVCGPEGEVEGRLGGVAPFPGTPFPPCPKQDGVETSLTMW